MINRLARRDESSTVVRPIINSVETESVRCRREGEETSNEDEASEVKSYFFTSPEVHRRRGWSSICRSQQETCVPQEVRSRRVAKINL